MRKVYYLAVMLFLMALMVFSGCSKDYQSYDELVRDGVVESSARKSYKKFFDAVDILAQNAETDSLQLKEVMTRTDDLIADLRDFPTTVQSRIALDGLSFAAADLAASPHFDGLNDISFFWRNGLLTPLFMLGRRYVGMDMENESTILQLVKALQRSMADKASDDMLMEMIQLVGPKPPESVFEVCRADSFVFKKVFDLLVYSRSLQDIGPPVWMMSGPWFVALVFENSPMQFYALKPIEIDDSMFLTFRNYRPGVVYEHVFEDPAPKDTKEMDGWLERASAHLDTLRFDTDTVNRIIRSDLPTFDSHYYYDNYLLGAKADTVKTEFRIIFKREQVQDGYDVAGVDSLEVILSEKEVMSRAEFVTPMLAKRIRGDSVVNGRLAHGKEEVGLAFLMPIGHHDEAIVDRIKRRMLPEIKVNTN